MRNQRFPRLPRLRPAAWVIQNRINAALGRQFDLAGVLDYRKTNGRSGEKGEFYLEKTVRRQIQKKDAPFYRQFSGFYNE